MFFPITSMRALDSSAGMQPAPALASRSAGGSFGPGEMLLADWERMLDVTLLSVAVLLFGAGLYWLVGA
jgi:hypothetical protein